MNNLAIGVLAALIALPGAALASPDYTTDAKLVKAAYAAVQNSDFAGAAQDSSIAAKAGNAEAQELLGGMYLTGHGETQDCGQALHWLGLSAKQGDAQAIYHYGVLTEDGICVKRDLVAAMSSYKTAAQSGMTAAQIGIGMMYHNAEGVPRDDAQAVKWLTEAANKNDALAQHELGLFAQAGWGAPANPVQAEMWMDLARKNATDLLLEITIAGDLKSLEANMTQAQIAQGDALAAAWKPPKEP